VAAVEIPQDEQAFLGYVQSGGQVETTDWMPEDYRRKLIKFIEMHGNSELMGVLPERESASGSSVPRRSSASSR
jgi:ring-1,2-phenylacetyl-CoA epoxidase subunit PaaA